MKGHLLVSDEHSGDFRLALLEIRPHQRQEIVGSPIGERVNGLRREGHKIEGPAAASGVILQHR